MIETVMLVVALVAFAVLVVGWMLLPDASVAEQASELSMPAAGVAEAA